MRPGVSEVYLLDFAHAETGSMQFVLLDVCLAFFVLFLLNIALVQRTGPRWLEPLRIHAANGFYMDTIYRRAFGSIARS